MDSSLPPQHFPSAATALSARFLQKGIEFVWDDDSESGSGDSDLEDGRSDHEGVHHGRTEDRGEVGVIDEGRHGDAGGDGSSRGFAAASGRRAGEAEEVVSGEEDENDAGKRDQGRETGADWGRGDCDNKGHTTLTATVEEGEEEAIAKTSRVMARAQKRLGGSHRYQGVDIDERLAELLR